METIKFSDFEKMDLRIGKILSAERVEGTNKLLKLQVDMGAEKRQLVAGIADVYDAKKLAGRQIVVLANLEPKTLKSVESRGMLLAAEENGKPTLLCPEKAVQPGTKVR